MFLMADKQRVWYVYVSKLSSHFTGGWYPAAAPSAPSWSAGHLPRLCHPRGRPGVLRLSLQGGPGAAEDSGGVRGGLQEVGSAHHLEVGRGGGGAPFKCTRQVATLHQTINISTPCVVWRLPTPASVLRGCSQYAIWTLNFFNLILRILTKIRYSVRKKGSLLLSARANLQFLHFILEGFFRCLLCKLKLFTFFQMDF